MRYFESILIIDEEGNDICTAIPREITAQEVIDVLRENLARASRPEPMLIAHANTSSTVPSQTVEAPKTTSKRGRKKPKKDGALKTVRAYDRKSCCGSKGPRHLKGCDGNGIPKPNGEDVYKGAEEKVAMLTETQYEFVKDAKENNFRFNALQTADEMSTSVVEVNRAILTKDYDAYVTSYRSTS